MSAITIDTIGVALAVAVAAAAWGCGSKIDEGSTSVDAGPTETPLQRYLHDPKFRRAELVASLVLPSNGYSSLRLGHYDTGVPGDWSELPEWNPRSALLTDLGADWTAPLGDDAVPLTIEAAASHGDEAALRALGERAFFRYPVMIAALPTSELDVRYDGMGFWRDAEHGLGGLVRAPLADGPSAVFVTCASCHAQSGEDGRLSIGRPNAKIFFGGGPYAPGLVDVTSDSRSAPVRIADLRPVRFLSYLQADATVAQRDVISLAIRIETLLVTSRERLLRPPREISLGLALYIWSLADGAPSKSTLTPAEQRGQVTFGAECARCHTPPSFTGEPVPIAEIGTDEPIAVSEERGTGSLRVPSLHFVATRGPLLSNGKAASLEVLMDPARVKAAPYSSSWIPGHAYGLELDDAARADLIAYLRTL
jgi:mono/diheme cytochrome c family protein